MSDVTRILDRVQQGDAQAAEELLPLVYEELRRLAVLKMGDQPAGHTLQPTALVHEAWLRLAGSPQREWQGRRHFYAAAAEAMRPEAAKPMAVEPKELIAMSELAEANSCSEAISGKTLS